MAPAQRRSPLEETHRALGARLTNFGGWDMPLQYAGVVREHNEVRSGCGLFDVSHLGKLSVTGGGAGRALQRALTADVEALPAGRAAYSLVLQEDGGCVDDVFCYRLSGAEWMVVPNAANNADVVEALRRCGAPVEDHWDRWAVLALQGPASLELFERVWPGAPASELKLHSWTWAELEGSRALVARTGYTGERGYELYAPADDAAAIWNRLLAAGAAPVGLGARDTLRLEMGYPLYGHELRRDVNPLEAGLGWALAWDTPFVGRTALAEVRERGPARRLFGIICKDRGVPRQGCAVLAGGDPVGEVTSGNFSPVLKTGIALAYGPSPAVPVLGAHIHVDVRGRPIAATVAKPPFIRTGTKE